MDERLIRVLVVEDHPLFRQGLRSSLDEVEDIEIVGEAEDAGQARRLAAALRPDVVLMDVDLAGESGVDLTAELTAALPEVAVVMLTMHDDEALVFAALCAGACGYLLKGVDQDGMARAIRSAAEGEAIFGPGVAGRVLRHLRREQPAEPPRNAAHGLSEREGEILDLMAEGWGNAEIAERLFLSPKTVRNNVSAIMAKLHSASRGEAIVRARTWGYGRSERS